MNRGRAFAVAVVVSACGWAASSLAASGLKTTSEAEELGVEEVASVAAKCKPGTKAVSGGFKTAFDPVTFPDTLVTANQRTSARRWSATAGNDGALGELRVYAYCRDQDLQTATRTVPAPSGVTDSQKARCPGESRAVSGGYLTTPIDYLAPTTPVMRIAESRRVGPRKWKVSYFNNGNADASVDVYVHCTQGKAPSVRKRTASLTDAGGTEVTPIKPRCKRGQRVVAGGFASPEPGKTAAAIIGTRRRSGRTWLVQARTGQLGAPVEVTAYAYCEKQG